jgi:hypothetical protein
MVMAKSVRMSVAVALALSALSVGACSSASSPGVTTPTATVHFDAGERASAAAVEGFVSAVAGAYAKAVASQSSVQSDGSGILSVGRSTPTATVPASCDSVALTYFTAGGQAQPAYDPARTTRIGAKGPCSTPYGPVTLDATADDAQASSSTVLINGTAQGTYDGYTVQVVVTNVRMTKQFCGAPASGVLVATTNGLVATIRFDGSLNAQATYTWSGIGVSFTVPLQPCS